MVIAMAKTELKRQIGLFDAVMLISGDMIGIGIFVTTGVIAETLPTPGGVLLVWILGGLLALTGALSYRRVCRTRAAITSISEKPTANSWDFYQGGRRSS